MEYNYKQVKNLATGEVDNTVIIRLPDNVWIPFSLANTDYANFKKDLADGVELLNAEGNVIDGIAYLATLES
jgi:hypothetical protein